ncbi:MAG: thioredoxin [Thermoleophilia bacterium]|jgi:thioredoxin 1|nr:thioredoxin [Thermoleophilia bacterium]
MADVIEIDSSTFQGLVLESDKPVIVDFWAPWCGPCRMIAPVIDEIARDREDVVVGKVNVDESPDIAQRYGIQGIPFIGLFENGELTRNAVGAMPRAGIEQALGLGG